jgi:glycosyltransferase involved in cell wall biosynthesis
LPVKFIVTGSASYGENWYEDELKKMAVRQLPDDIIFTGFREDIAGILSAVDILAFPSHEESYGITLAEAMAMGVPIVASNNAGVTDVVINGITGILVPPRDPVSLGNAIKGLIENPGLRKKLGEAGRKRAEEKFDLRKMITGIENVYKELRVDN